MTILGQQERNHQTDVYQVSPKFSTDPGAFPQSLCLWRTQQQTLNPVSEETDDQ